MATIATPVRIGLADRGRRMTLDEYLEAEVEEGFRYELAAGVLEVTQVPNDPHRQVVTNLYDAIRACVPSLTSACRLELRRRIRVPAWASWDDHWTKSGPGRRPSRRHPRVRADRRWPGAGRRGRFAATVSSRDYVTKREEYLAYGLQTNTGSSTP